MDGPTKALYLRLKRPPRLGSAFLLVFVVTAALVSSALWARPFNVVIDPGHGGKDHGAQGFYWKDKRKIKVVEKDLSLRLSKMLRKELFRRKSSFNIHLTREKDKFVSLRERGEKAQEAKANLFLSIHANSSKRREYRGLETYVLNNATSEYEKHLQKKENAWSGDPSTLGYIVSDLMMASHVEASARFARKVQSQMVRSFRQGGYATRNRGIKQALFSVLFHAQSPGVLIETGFLSNPREALWLNNRHYQGILVRSLADSVEQWFKKLTPSEALPPERTQVISFSTGSH